MPRTYSGPTTERNPITSSNLGNIILGELSRYLQLGGGYTLELLIESIIINKDKDYNNQNNNRNQNNNGSQNYNNSNSENMNNSLNKNQTGLWISHPKEQMIQIQLLKNNKLNKNLINKEILDELLLTNIIINSFFEKIIEFLYI
jgi:hypothetical protein